RCGGAVRGGPARAVPPWTWAGPSRSPPSPAPVLTVTVYTRPSADDRPAIAAPWMAPDEVSLKSSAVSPKTGSEKVTVNATWAAFGGGGPARTEASTDGGGVCVRLGGEWESVAVWRVAANAAG